MIVNMREGMRFGMGMDRLTEQVRGQALEFDEIQRRDGGQQVRPNVQMIQEQSQLQESMNISVAASVRYGMASVDARMDFAKSHAVNSFSQYILFKCTVRNPAAYMVRPRLSAIAQEVYGKNPEEFRAVFGDSYIDEIFSGGDFYGLFVMETKDERTKEELGAKLSAKVNGLMVGGEINAEFKNVTEEFQGKTTTTIDAIINGGAAQANPTDVEDLRNLYQSFNKSVLDSPIDYQASLKEFKYLPMPSGPTWVENIARQHTIETCGRYVIDALATRSNVEYLLKYPEQFEAFDKDAEQEVREWLGNLDQRISQWARRAGSCSSDINECAIGQDEQPLSAPKIPVRIQSADPLQAKWDEIKRHDERARPYFAELGPDGPLSETYEKGPRDGRFRIFKDLKTGVRLGGIFWEPQRGAHVVYGRIFAEYDRRGLCHGSMGYPVSD